METTDLKIDEYYLISNEHLQYAGEENSLHLFRNCNNGLVKFTDTQVRERVNFINNFNRDSFMSFFRDGDKYNELSVDDKIEVFSTAIHGSSDFSVDLLKSILSDYNVSHIEVTDETLFACLLDCNSYDDLLEITDDEFHKRSLVNGDVYPIDKLAEAFNREEISTAQNQMRLIKIKNSHD